MWREYPGELDGQKELKTIPVDEDKFETVKEILFTVARMQEGFAISHA
jgi:hypothetical protein